jgi:HSP90 family molecular chaperone
MSEPTPPASHKEAESLSFKAETRQLLNILIHSLYKDREVFLRELLSNASDALNRVRFELLTEHQVLEPGAELCIHITADKEKRLLTIQDTGIGMAREEIIENLGTIAHSGARKFMEATRDQKTDFSQVIGQFGVGFYSVFMVAESVQVTSRSFRPRARAVSWLARGEDNYEVSIAEMTSRGTKVEIKLKEDASEFADEFRLKEIIHKHSDYIGFPIYLGDAKEPVNKRISLWRTPKQEVTADQYKEFYRQSTLDFDDPLLHIHLVTDVPVQLYALLYIPGKGERSIFSLRKEDGLKLYSRNILIDEYNKNLLPEYLRFVQGVVDSEDLPLNVSRETIQSSSLMDRLKKVLANQVVKDLETLAAKEPEKFQQFWKEFGNYIKQGVAMVPAEADQLYPLLRFKTNLHPEAWNSLVDYTGRMKPDQKVIYYIVGDDPKSVLRSPHLEPFQAQELEVLLLTEPMDSFMLMGFKKYKDFDLKNAAQAELPEKATEEAKSEKIADNDFQALAKRFKEVLGERVTDVRATSRLSDSVARLVDPDGAPNPEMQRVYKYLGREFEQPKKILELNPSHSILKNLLKLESGAALQSLIIEQIFESALLVEGLHPDPSGMVPRLQQIMEAALDRAAQAPGKE